MTSPDDATVAEIRAQAVELIAEAERVAQRLNDHVELMRIYLARIEGGAGDATGQA